MPKKSKDELAHQRITDHEKLCRIMQKQTQAQISKVQKQIDRLEKILLTSTGFLLTSMLGIIVALIFRVL
tara:strand:- start:189 stop:398 length:210 start_codon:yes stop_codon:yes gene_type:complete